jgi:thiamine-phosphate pyrophosphorylase
MSLPDPPLLLITDRRLASGPLVDVVTAAFEGGCRWVMVREKDLATAQLAPLVAAVVTAARPYGATVTVNGDAEAARVARAHGVHLPQRTVAETGVPDTGALVGVSAHSPGEAEEAAARPGVGYVTMSPVFGSVSKSGYGPCVGLGGLRAAAEAVDCPVVALGGVTAGNAADCLAAGAAGVAVLGSVMQADEPFAAASSLVRAVRAAQPK